MKKGLILLILSCFVILIMGMLVLQTTKASAQSQARYVGVDKCKGCHPKEYKDFEGRKFSKAWAVLEMRGKTSDGECLKCHATGYGKPSGYVSEEATPHLKYKQCEACHGPGSVHADNPMDVDAKNGMKKYVRDEDVCIKCHECMRTHKSSEF